MYTLGRGPVKVKDAMTKIVEEVARRKPKSQVATQPTIKVDNEVEGSNEIKGRNEVENGDEIVHLELREVVFGNKITDPFAAQYDGLKF
jgi:hypothetical protein